jgi:hypothetical protein
MNNRPIIIAGALVTLIATLGFVVDLIEAHKVIGTLGVCATLVGVYLMLWLVNRDAAKEVKRLRAQKERKDQASE